MANKKLKARIQLKHDTEANWNAASTFAPLPGEVVVFEPDDTHEYSRFKVGRKKSETENCLLSELPFVTDQFPKLSSANEFTEPNTFALYDPDTGVKVFEATAQGKSFVIKNLDESGNTLQAAAIGLNGPTITNNSSNKQTQYRIDAIRKVDTSGEEKIIETYKLPEKGKTGSYTFATTDDGITIIEKTGISVPTTENMPAADLGLTTEEKTTIDGKDLSLISFNVNGMMFYYSGDYKYDQYVQELPSTSTGKNYFLQIVLETQNTPYIQSGSVKMVTVESGGGSGDVTAAGDNIFTGKNTFQTDEGMSIKSVDGSVGVKLNPFGTFTLIKNNSSSFISLPTGTGTLVLSSELSSYAKKSDIPDTSTFVKLSGDNMFSGSNIFTYGSVTIGPIGLAEKTTYKKDGIQHMTATAINNVFNFPAKAAGSYTFATTDDITPKVYIENSLLGA